MIGKGSEKQLLEAANLVKMVHAGNLNLRGSLFCKPFSKTTILIQKT